MTEKVLKVVEGQITAIDHPAHKNTVKDRAGESHTMIWGPALNDQMSKLQQWWFTKITGEFEKDVDLWRLTNQSFFKRPDDWATAPRKLGGGGFGGQPRNDKAIMFECALKVMGDLYVGRLGNNSSGQPYEKAVEEEIAAAVKATEEGIKLTGV